MSYNKEKEHEKKFGVKKVNSFCINDSWYNDDVSVYRVNKDSIDEKGLDNFYAEKITKFVDQFKQAKKVQCCCCMYLSFSMCLLILYNLYFDNNDTSNRG